jgi:N4-gp56 family major capsid protein
VAAYAVAKLLKRAIPYLVIEKFGTTYPIPQKNTLVAKFRRFNALPINATPLTEGVTPDGTPMTVSDYTATLTQYGDFIEITDVVMDTSDDPVMEQATEVLAEQAAQTIETMRFNVLVAGTNVQYANGTSRSAVNTPLTLALQRGVTRALARQNARHITNIVRSTPDYGTAQVAASYVALCHPDVEYDIRNMTGYVPIERYGTLTPWENEVGKVEQVRYLTSTIFQPFENAGGAISTATNSTTNMLSTGGVDADVYPILYLAKNAYGIVPLKGKDSLSVMVVNPMPAASDPLAQRGTAGWKTMQTCVILNDAWMLRLEVGASALA